MEVGIISLAELFECLKCCFFYSPKSIKYCMRLADVKMFDNFHYHKCAKYVLEYSKLVRPP